MRRRRSLASLLAALVFLTGITSWTIRPPTIVQAANPPAACAPDSGSGSISGTVTAAGGTPLQYVQVEAYTPYGDRGGYTSTNASGNYTIVGLGSGSYTLKASPIFGENLIGTPQTVSLTAPNTLSGVNFTMAPGGTLTGRVTDASGTPLKDITIFIGNQDNSYQEYVYTNASGVYAATALPSGVIW